MDGWPMRDDAGPPEPDGRSLGRRTAFRFVLLVGILSFFADFTYEGARSALGPYMAVLGASGGVVAAVSGLGEFLGYGLRLVSGRLADTTRRFWPVAVCGYAVQMAAVPALALTRTWPEAAALILLERIGKAVRNPSRDAMLADAATRISGYGLVFGIHEALDQFGALVGPLMVAVILAREHDYHLAFAALLVPALINLACVALTRRLHPQPSTFAVAQKASADGFWLTATFWTYLAAAGFIGAGYADYSLIAYHLGTSHIATGSWIAVFYSVAMAVSGGGALLFGRLFDRYGFSVLIGLTVVSTAYAPLVFLGNFWTSLLGAGLWGLAMGAQESIIPAAVAPLVPPDRRASAFGLFTAGYGSAWFAGSILMGLLYDCSISLAVTFCIACELAGLPLLLRVRQLR